MDRYLCDSDYVASRSHLSATRQAPRACRGPVRQDGRLEHRPVPAAEVGAGLVRRLQERMGRSLWIGALAQRVVREDELAESGIVGGARRLNARGHVARGLRVGIGIERGAVRLVPW